MPLVSKLGVKVRCEGIVSPDGQVIREVDENGYNKYLGELEGADVMQKEKVKQVYLRRVLVARSKLYRGNLMRAINALGERCGEVHNNQDYFKTAT